DRVLGDRPNQTHRLREDVDVRPSQLVDLTVPNAAVTFAGIETNIDVALHYIEAWLRGQGAVAIHNLMEDAATAEISRSQLWQWTTHRVQLDGGGTMTANTYRSVRDEVLAQLSAVEGLSRLRDAAALLDDLVL